MEDFRAFDNRRLERRARWLRELRAWRFTEAGGVRHDLAIGDRMRRVLPHGPRRPAALPLHRRTHHRLDRCQATCLRRSMEARYAAAPTIGWVDGRAHWLFDMSSITCIAQLRPGAPNTAPPGQAPLPQR